MDIGYWPLPGRRILSIDPCRYDSEYARRMTRGDWKPKTNVGLVERAKYQLRRTLEEEGVIIKGWKW